LLAGLVALATGPGCGLTGDDVLSPTPDQDPARHARAVVEMEEVAQRNKEAEARFFRKAARPILPEALTETNPDAPHPGNPDTPTTNRETP
jgi:hypothetical protein